MSLINLQRKTTKLARITVTGFTPASQDDSSTYDVILNQISKETTRLVCESADVITFTFRTRIETARAKNTRHRSGAMVINVNSPPVTAMNKIARADRMIAEMCLFVERHLNIYEK